MKLSRRHLLGLGAATLCSDMLRAAEEAKITFAQLYDTGPAALKISARLEPLQSQSVSMRGFMAPPLKSESDFFVLTRLPMSVCPFCSSGMEWPADIVVVYLSKSAQALSPSQLISVTGKLDLGLKMDPNTAFVSLIRIVDAQWAMA